MRRPFSFFLFFRRCCFSSYSTFSAAFSGLCSLFSFPVRSLGHNLLNFLMFCFFLSVLSDVYGATVLRLPYFPWRFSCPFRVPHLFFGTRLIFLFVFASPILVISPPPPAFTSEVLGFDSVIGVAPSPAVPAVAPPFFRPFVSVPGFPLAAVPAVPCSLSQRFSACCGYGWFFRSSSAFSACCSSGCSFRSSFPHAASPATPFVFDAAPAIYLAVACSSSGFGCFYSLSLYSFPIDGLSFTTGLFPQAAFSPFVSPPPRACLRCSSIRLRFLFSRSALPCLCNKIVSLVLMTRSDLQFPS